MSIYIEVSMHCPSCERQIDPKLVTENDIRRGHCFRCHVKGVTFGFKGVAYGRSNWNGATVREVQKSYEESDAFKQGRITKVSARKELI